MQDRQPKMREFMKYSSFYYTYGFPQKFMVRVKSNFIGGRTTLKPHKGSDQNPMRHAVMPSLLSRVNATTMS